ncbi:hypothetical protein [Halorientalis marina]|jgi:succinate dehydrogenase flavin-adding protein (antitoxin of CptAB toxin-antitoxin module)|uniref:hypothetical protein n=1 Tax=Halorientalis marina TaxID=2931976 RepID=UPI001FF51D37|nr:hypothetical protein [Halorientalis marina]
MADDLLRTFDDDIVALVADRTEPTAERLTELLRAHQQQVRDNPGVEDIVYEWRSQFHEAPLLHRTADAYYLRLRTHVWEEFASALDIPDVELDALLDAHEEQVRRETGAERGENERFMVLTRE